MKNQDFIETKTICYHYNIEVSLINTLSEMQLINIEIIEQKPFIHQDQIGLLEKIIRLRNELNVNLEGIDVILNLLEKEKELKKEVNFLKNRLRLYENE
ncbi:chaperone modulator CbpM [Psychroflexus halocasei]|uniref:MerR HTH family regulatory protein n=1 Tax=Psychroflexus halocasei TaxID=908615 RepID=A0A1H3ZWG8_9FLAO|nr:chaperone modulator CbpM [Psychroflexus halocasei]SEA28103.1 MerR HTH family regulatory protein [Psychroflexus halocasei]